MNIIEGLTFDDVFLIPKYSNIEHRAEVSTKTQILPSFTLDVPFVSANMDTVTEHKMAFSMMEHGGVGILHRYLSIENMLEQIELYNAELATHKVSPKAPFIVSIGANDFERVKAAYTAGIRNFCIDVAHGHHLLVERCIQKLKELYSDIGIIAGNVCTYQGAYDLFKWGADCVKVGVGPGSVCTTRIKTGSGYPQLSAIKLAFQAKKDFQQANPNSQKFIIADGGIKYYGDLTKAIAAGGDAVMMGSLFAGCKQTPGTVFRNENEEMVKSYRGMASIPAQSDFGIEDFNEEGISLTVKYRGNVKHIIERLVKGLRSGMSYSGARDIKTLQEVAEFVKVTQSGHIEGQPHKAFKN
jgi:IMP dehydrogenase